MMILNKNIWNNNYTYQIKIHLTKEKTEFFKKKKLDNTHNSKNMNIIMRRKNMKIKKE